MRIKKYEVTDMKEALRLIKNDLGSDAVILSTRKVTKNKSFGLFSRPILEVTAAVDYDELKPAAENRSRSRTESKPAANPDAPWYLQEDEESYFDEEQAAVYTPGARLKKPESLSFPEHPDLGDDPTPEQSIESLMNKFGSSRPAPKPKPINVPKPKPEPIHFSEQEIERSVPHGGRPSDAGNDVEKLSALINTLGLNKFEKMISDVMEIKRQIAEMQSSLSGNVVIDLPDRLKEYYNLMVKNGVDDVIAYKFLKKLEKRVSENFSQAQVRNLVMQMLAELLPIETDYFTSLHRKVIALVGPTGVGKTTTIAKMAATIALTMQKKVCLITIDNFRIGAVEQLRTYAEIVNVPLYTASSPEELSEIIKETSDYDYVFLDSMGRSQFDTKQIDSILEFLDVSPLITVTLVLSMAGNHMEMNDTFERYSKLHPEYLLFTKLDETRYYGPMVNLPLKKKVPIMLISNGQNVPDDMEIPDGKKIAKKVLAEIPGLWSE